MRQDATGHQRTGWKWLQPRTDGWFRGSEYLLSSCLRRTGGDTGQVPASLEPGPGPSPHISWVRNTAEAACECMGDTRVPPPFLDPLLLFPYHCSYSESRGTGSHREEEHGDTGPHWKGQSWTAHSRFGLLPSLPCSGSLVARPSSRESGLLPVYSYMAGHRFCCF